MSSKKEKDEKILSVVRHRFRVANDVSSESRKNQLDDKRFLAASPDTPQWQWPSEVLATRTSQAAPVSSRPCLVMNKLPQHVRQITNEVRQNRPSGKVIPANEDASVELAEIYDGMIRHIEYTSNADIAYETANESQTAEGEGFWRILTEYVSEDSFDQEIKIARVRNNFSVYMDPMIQDPCGEDAKWCIISDDLTIDEYETQFPNASKVSTLLNVALGDQNVSEWVGEKTIRIVEYFYVHLEEKTLNLYPGNITAYEGTPEDEALKIEFPDGPVRTRKTHKRSVKWLKTNGFEILEERKWAGSYIPVIRVVGNEFEINGKVHVSGIVRNAKDAQRMYNYWVSQEAEMLALAPKAPFVGYAGQFEGFENTWKTANTQNHPYLEVNAVVDESNGNVLPLPQRAQPPMVQAGLIAAKQGAAEDIKSTTGQYNASLGMESNERSGKAILARKMEGDIGTYHYQDNLSKAIRYSTKQIVELIPRIYDTERIARIVGEDGEPEMVKIDPTQPEAVRRINDAQGNLIEKIYNPSVGKYDVRVITGPGYATKRQEALEAMAQLLQGNPQLWAVAGDLFIKNMDWPGAQELANRFAKTIDPKLLQNGDENPALMAAQEQIQMMAQEMDQMFQMLQNVNQSIEARDVMIKGFEAQIKAYDAETKRIAALQDRITPEQIQDIVQGTIDAMLQTGDLVGQIPSAAPLQEPIAPPAPQVPEMGLEAGPRWGNEFGQAQDPDPNIITG